jgi:hypothetical protein
VRKTTEKIPARIREKTPRGLNPESETDKAPIVRDQNPKNPENVFTMKTLLTVENPTRKSPSISGFQAGIFNIYSRNP